MRIAQLAPLAESVPPKLYGGTERVVAWLVDELVELGHHVTLFASGDSRTRGELHAVWPRALRLGRKGDGPERRLRSAAGSDREAGQGFRRDPRTHRLAAPSAPQPPRRAVSHDHARAARPAGIGRRHSRISASPLRVDFRRSAPAAPGRELDRDDPTWAALGSVSPVLRARIVSGLSRPSRGGKGPGRRHPHRARSPKTPAHRSQDTSPADRVLP